MFGGFDDIFGNMDRMMNNMMNGMMAPPFGVGMMGSNLMGNQMQLMNNHHRNQMNNQLAMFGGGMNMGAMMGPGNMTSFSMTSMPGQSVSYSSKVMSISNDPSTGKPIVYEQTSSKVSAGDGVYETKETVKDSRTGLQQIKVGRHINDKGHTKAKKRNVYTGDESDEEELINLEENEVEQFNDQFTNLTRDYRQKYHSIQSHPSHHAGRQRLALTNGPPATATSSSQQHYVPPSQYMASAASHHQPPVYNLSHSHLQQEDTRPPSRGKKVKEDKKLKKKSSKKPY